MAEYEKKVRKLLSQNQCKFVRHGKETMTSGSALYKTVTLPLILKLNQDILPMPL